MDKKAKNILFRTYWKNGWISDKDRKTDPIDFEYAKSKGVMFDNINITHDQCIIEILGVVKDISIQSVSKAFLGSLTNNRLDWRSAIASFHIAKMLPKHKYKKTVSGHGYDNHGNINYTSYSCGVCMDLNYHIFGYEKYSNIDLNILNFERLKWGGVRHGDLVYTLFDLKSFTNENIIDPTNKDIEIFKKILDTIETSQEKDYPGKLEQRLSQIIKSTKYERKTLLEIMACIGILKPGSYDRPSTDRNDWKYVEYWRGEDKYNKEMVEMYFGEYINK